jgi:hypothetical protein
MSDIPGETNLNSGDPGRSPETGQDEIQAWADWFSPSRLEAIWRILQQWSYAWRWAIPDEL